LSVLKKANIVIASNLPKRLAVFYSCVFENDFKVGVSPEHFVIEINQVTTIHIYKPSKKRDFPARGKTVSICVEKISLIDPITELRDFVQILISIGASIIENPRLEKFGAEAWLADPEGNEFLVLVTSQ